VVDTHANESRYRLLETLRQYGRQKLIEAGEAEKVLGRHRDWFLELAREAEPQLRGPEQLRWLHVLDLEHDNLRAALDWSLETGDIDSSLGLAGAMGFFWRMRGFWSDGLNRLERALAGARGEPLRRAKALLWASALAMELGEHAKSERLAQQGRGEFTDVGDSWGVGFCCHILGFIAFRQDDLVRAAALLEESGDAFRKSNDIWGSGLALHSLGFLYSARGEYKRALDVASDGLALFRLAGDSERIAASVQLLGVVQLSQGNFSAAQSLLNECLEMFRELGARPLLAGALYDLGVIARCLGDYEQAGALLQASLDQYREFGNPHGSAYLLNEMGILALRQGKVGRAEGLLKEGLQKSHDLKDKFAFAQSLDGLAAAAFLLTRTHRAAALLGASDAIRHSIGISIEPFEKESREGLVAQVQATLGMPEFVAAKAGFGSGDLDEYLNLGLDYQDTKRSGSVLAGSGMGPTRPKGASARTGGKKRSEGARPD
jgi:tetratricopeptide (TPR) repeat protein